MAVAAAFFIGGYCSDFLEPRPIGLAMKVVFFGTAAVIATIFLLALLGPKLLFAQAEEERRRNSADLRADLVRLAKHKPIYPAIAIQFLWQFAPASGAALQFYVTNHLHATGADWGAFNGLWTGLMIPMVLLYDFLSPRIAFRRLLLICALISAPQMIPLLFIPNAAFVRWDGAFLGLTAGLAQTAYMDLAIRSCPRGLQGTMMMLITTTYFLAAGASNLLGAWLYDLTHSFMPAVAIATACNLLVIPLIFLIPKAVAQTRSL
jgi:Na+/melibiose symporter-like transporter